MSAGFLVFLRVGSLKAFAIRNCIAFWVCIVLHRFHARTARVVFRGRRPSGATSSRTPARNRTNAPSVRSSSRPSQTATDTSSASTMPSGSESEKGSSLPTVAAWAAGRSQSSSGRQRQGNEGAGRENGTPLRRPRGSVQLKRQLTWPWTTTTSTMLMLTPKQQACRCRSRLLALRRPSQPRDLGDPRRTNRSRPMNFSA